MPGTTRKTMDAILFGGEVRTERQLIAEGYESTRMIAERTGMTMDSVGHRVSKRVADGSLERVKRGSVWYYRPTA